MSQSHQHIPIKPVLIACVGSIMLGFSPIFVRVSDLGPMTTGFYRMLCALPFLWIWMQLERRHFKSGSLPNIPLKDYIKFGLAGVFFALDLALWNWSLDYTVFVNATLFENTAAFLVPILMWFLYSERQPLRLILGAVVGFIGCVLLVGDSFSIGISNFKGDIAALGSGLMVAFYIIAIKKIRDRYQTGTLMFFCGITAMIGLGIFGLIMGESFWPLTGYDYASVFGQAVVAHIMGQAFIAYALGKIPASYGALILLLCPVTAAIIGWVGYDESLNLVKFIGIILVMGSIISVRERRLKSKQQGAVSKVPISS